MVSLFLLLGCNLSYIVDLFAALHELASASARTLLKLASSLTTECTIEIHHNKKSCRFFRYYQVLVFFCFVFFSFPDKSCQLSFLVKFYQNILMVGTVSVPDK